MMRAKALPLLAGIAAVAIAASSAGAAERLASVEQAAPIRRADTSATLPVKPMPEADSRTLPKSNVVAVMVDRAKIVRLPERTQTVIIGNPGIADVSLQKNGIVVLTGKSYGLTNIIALDGTGAVLVESTVSVQAATDSIVVVQRGMDRESYSCTPRCQPSILLGDSTKYFGEVTSQASQHTASASAK